MRNSVLAVLAASCLAAPAFAQPKRDAPNCNDHPSFARVQGYVIESCTLKPTGSYSFDLGKGRSVVEGKYWYIRYLAPPGTKPSTAQVLSGAVATVTKAGGEVLNADSNKETIKLRSVGKETWVEVWADHTGKYILTIVERPASGPTEAQAAIAPKTVTSPPIRIMGTRSESITVTTASIHIVGTRSEPVAVTTAAIHIVGTRSDPLILTTAALKIFGTASAPTTVTTAPIRIVGTRSDSLTIMASAISIIGTRSDPVTITTQGISVVGVRGTHEPKVPVDLKRQ